MSTRDFVIIPPTSRPGQLEITIDRGAAGWEQTCDLCGSVLQRQQPGADRAQTRSPRAFARLELTAHVPGSQSYQLQLPADLCGPCTANALAPVAGLIRGLLHDVPPEIARLLGFDAGEHQAGEVATAPLAGV